MLALLLRMLVGALGAALRKDTAATRKAPGPPSVGDQTRECWQAQLARGARHCTRPGAGELACRVPRRHGLWGDTAQRSTNLLEDVCPFRPLPRTCDRVPGAKLPSFKEPRPAVCNSVDALEGIMLSEISQDEGDRAVRSGGPISPQLT